MKPEQIYHELIALAEKFDITVSEQNFRSTSLKAKSGLCVVKGQKRFIMDKHLKLHAKIDALAACLNQLPHEDVFIIPALREVLNRSG
jgi:hypothetical protein